MCLLSFNEDAQPQELWFWRFVFSVLLGGLARVVTKFKATPDELSLCRFFTLEFLDLSCDILACVFCFVEGDLEFADDGGLISMLLLASVVASGVFFLMELPLWFTSPGRFREWTPLLSCLHLAGEDFYQFILYSVVAASQSAGGLGRSTACLPAVAESTLFIFLKFFHLVDHRMRCDRRGLDATPEAAVADPDTCGWTSTESAKG